LSTIGDAIIGAGRSGGSEPYDPPGFPLSREWQALLDIQSIQTPSSEQTDKIAQSIVP